MWDVSGPTESGGRDLKFILPCLTVNAAACRMNQETQSRVFRTTHWTQLLEATRPEDPAGQTALADFCETYWRPLYAFVRRKGFAQMEAEDLTQEFFARLITRNSLSGVRREGGRFRSFLLRSMENFLADEWDRSHAKKRGGGQKDLSIDVLEGEARLEALTIACEGTPETVFERQWAIAILEKVGNRLSEGERAAGRGKLYEDLKLHLQSDHETSTYAEIAERHSMTEGSIKVAVHRLRRRFGDYLRAEIASTVRSDADVNDELKHLIAVMKQ